VSELPWRDITDEEKDLARYQRASLDGQTY